MIEMKREGGEWQVVVDGAVVFSGSMLEARTEYSKRQAARLNVKDRAVARAASGSIGSQQWACQRFFYKLAGP